MLLVSSVFEHLHAGIIVLAAGLPTAWVYLERNMQVRALVNEFLALQVRPKAYQDHSMEDSLAIFHGVEDHFSIPSEQVSGRKRVRSVVTSNLTDRRTQNWSILPDDRVANRAMRGVQLEERVAVEARRSPYSNRCAFLSLTFPTDTFRPFSNFIIPDLATAHYLSFIGRGA